MTGSGDNTKSQSVGIVGAGLVGCLAAIAFAKKGYQVTVFELRNDPRKTKTTNLRSINLAVSARGIKALELVDESIASKVLSSIVPMKGRMIHSNGKLESQIYGLHGECINSIDRQYLNDSLLDEVDKLGISLLFDHKLSKLDGNKISFANSKNYEFDYLIGADGSHSQFRYQLQKSTRMNFSQTFIDMQYIELYIPPKNSNGDYSFDKNHLHIWPKKDYMLIALPNSDGSFTVTFFSPWSVIEGINNEDEWVDFFRINFPDAADLMTDEYLKKSFLNPRGSLVQIDAFPYHNKNSLIIGDAAHSMVPFYGQGMNCGFEDVTVLMELIDEYEDIPTAFEKYSLKRRSDLKAICKLALDNYYEMSSKVVDPFYLFKKKIDYFLGKYSNKYFQWLPLYTMISFRDDISYSKAIEIEKRQKFTLQSIQWGVITGVVALGAFKAADYYNRLKR